MNDFKFGNRLYKMRKQSGLTQNELAKMINVTNKAVSKWENGKSKPSIETIKKLSVIFKVPIESLLLDKGENKMQIEKIVITGGPCAGKSTAMSRIQNTFTQMGWNVLFVPETATELISGGVAPWTLTSNIDYQICQMKLQLEKEKVFAEAAKKVFNFEKILIVCDRGAVDSKAYMTDLEFASVLSILGLNEIELRDTYGAVFHLVSAAKGAEEFYTLANNPARTETVDEAAALDDKLISAWTGHPHLRIIDNSGNFEDKMKKLISEISTFLGEPEPYEIERKFLIEYPDIKMLEANPYCRKVEIIQTYLNSTANEEVRIRQRGENGHYIYFKTTKKRITDVKRIETEKKLNKEEYLTLLMEADTSKKQIRKTRYCLTYENQYFEIDVYPFWKDKAIMEIELRSETEDVTFPDFIEVIKEVTDDEAYKNASLATKGDCL